MEPEFELPPSLVEGGTVYPYRPYRARALDVRLRAVAGIPVENPNDLEQGLGLGRWGEVVDARTEVPFCLLPVHAELQYLCVLGDLPVRGRLCLSDLLLRRRPFGSLLPHSRLG